MKSLIAFIKKEMLEQVRSGRLMIMGILFVLLGVMNPAVAKLTPWLLEIMADSLAESGMTVTTVTVSAMDSWVQFFKNMPIGLIAFVLLQSSIFTKEYSSGTLVLSLTKGLERYKVVLAKSAVLTALWSVGYWACYGITFAYNGYFWDNAAAKSLTFSGICWWVFGLWVISMMVLFSVVANANTGVLLGCGGPVLVSYMIGFLPKVEEYVPTLLTNGNALIYGVSEAEAYVTALIVTAVLSLACFAAAVPILNRKRM